MTQMSCASMVAEIKTRMGRTSDTGVITGARILLWLNDGQRAIAQECVGLPALEMKNTTSVDWTETLSYNLSDFTSPFNDTTTENHVCYLWNVWFHDGADSYKLQYMPTDEFDAKIIDPTHSDHATSQPKWWTRRGNHIEAYPLSACAYCDKDIRLDGQFYPRDFTSADSTARTSDLQWADEGLISYSLWKGWRAIGGPNGQKEEAIALAEYQAWLSDYRSSQLKPTEWDQNLYGEWE